MPGLTLQQLQAQGAKPITPPTSGGVTQNEISNTPSGREQIYYPPGMTPDPSLKAPAGGGMTLEQLQAQGATPSSAALHPSVQAMDSQLHGGFMSKLAGASSQIADVFKNSINKATSKVENIADITSIPGQGNQGKTQSLPEGVAQTVGTAIGAGWDIIGGLASLAIPQSTKDMLAKSPLVHLVGQAVDSQTGQKILGTLGQIAQDHPRVMRDLDAALNIGSIIPGVKGAEVAGEAAVKGVDLAAKGVDAAGAAIQEARPVLSDALGGAANKLEAAGKARDLAVAHDVVSPAMSTAEKAAALEKGQGVAGKLGSITLNTADNTKMAESVAGIVKGKNPVSDISAIRDHIAAASENLRTALQEHPGTFNNSEIKKAFSAVKDNSRVLFGSDKTLEKSYDAVAGEFMRILKTKGNTLGGVLDARQEFDKVIESKFPGLLGNPAGDNLRRNAILDVRRAANQFIEDKLPAGSAMREVLQRQTNQYNAIENIAQKAAKSVNTGLVQRALDTVTKNPALSTLAALGVGANAHTIIGALTSPIGIAALVGTGAYKVGKTVLTSDAVNEFLIKALRASSDALRPEEKAALQGLADTLKEAKVASEATK